MKLAKHLEVGWMRTLNWTLCTWPGLPYIWLRGQWSGFLPAAVFAAWLNFTLLATFAWTDWVSGSLVTLSQIGLAGFWLHHFFRSCHCVKDWRDRQAADYKQLFIQAQTEYLRGNWIESESLVRQILLVNERDVESHLLLVALLRQTGRLGDARKQLGQLARIDGSDKWQLEIQQERTRIKQWEEDARPLANNSDQRDNMGHANCSDEQDVDVDSSLTNKLDNSLDNDSHLPDEWQSDSAA